VVNPKRPSNLPAALACVEARDRFLTLVIVELRLAPHLDASAAGRRPALMRSLGNALALVLGHGAQEGDEAPAERRCEVQVRLVEHLDQGAAGVDALDDGDAIQCTSALADTQEEYVQGKTPDLRVRACTKLVSQDGIAAWAYYNRGIAYIHKRDHDRAIADFNKMIEIDPLHANAYFNRGLAFRGQAQLRPRHS
jgi:tetratricopeptide (TPR) repeat protein